LAERPPTLTQLFFGQLPYKVSDRMVLWLVGHLAQRNVLYIERVMQDKSRKGCMQVFVDEDDASDIIAALDRRIIFDTTGIWHAQNDEQVRALEEHCRNESNRFKGFPYRMMVVERSTSTYVRRHKLPNRSRSATPPPPPQQQQEEDLEEDVVGAVDGEAPAEAPICYCEMCTGQVPYSSFYPPAAYTGVPTYYSAEYPPAPYYYY